MRLKKTKRNNRNIYLIPSSLGLGLLPLPWNLSRLGSHDWDGGVTPERGPLV